MKKDYEYSECLTNEKLMKNFKSQFDLVKFGIERAKEVVEAGRETETKYDGHNIVSYILAQIATRTESSK